MLGGAAISVFGIVAAVGIQILGKADLRDERNMDPYQYRAAESARRWNGDAGRAGRSWKPSGCRCAN